MSNDHAMMRRVFVFMMAVGLSVVHQLDRSKPAGGNGANNYAVTTLSRGGYTGSQPDVRAN